jgi:cytidylate kinase
MTGAVVFIANLNWALAIGILSYLFLEGGFKKIVGKRKMNSFEVNKSLVGSVNTDGLVITIDQEYCCSGVELARSLSKSLGIPCYQKEILLEASKLSGIPVKLMERYDDKPTCASMELKSEAAEGAENSPEIDYISAQVEALRKIAARGSCILVDRHAHLALGENEHCVHVHVRAPEQVRIKAYEEKHEVGRAEAVSAVRNIDRQRKKYVRDYAKTGSGAGRYHVSLDISELGVNGASKQIMGLLETAGANGRAEKAAVKGA